MAGSSAPFPPTRAANRDSPLADGAQGLAGDGEEGLPRADAPAWRQPVGLQAVIKQWVGRAKVWRNIALDAALQGQPAREADIPAELSPAVRQALWGRGITRLFSHQAHSIERVHAGADVAVATPTASGKSLCYNLPVVDAIARDASACALYLFPTKALARDQEQSLRRLMQEAELRTGAITFDGDTPADARRAAKQRSGVILSNPDMLHAGMLPHHTSWARLFANLRYVVVDELHTYRGVFGSHLANVLRRLQRIAHFHGSKPQFIFASATIGNPAEHASRMIGRSVELIGESGAPTGPRRVLLYNPPVVNAELGIRESYVKASVKLTVDLVRAQVPTLVFGQSRNNVEVMLKYLRDRLARYRVPASAIHAYRGGYLPETRRQIEAGLRHGEIRCVVATNALELGIDIGMLDAVICAGYPGSVAGLWQRFGRAGRRGDESLALLVASSAPHDQFFAADPEQLMQAEIEQARIDPDNVEILVQHLKCAAFELPFQSGEAFGDVPAEPVDEALEYLADGRVVHPVQGPDGTTTYHWANDAYPANHVSLRSIGWDNFVIVDVGGEQRSSRTIGEMDWRSTHTMLHEQAIYQHQGEQYQVEKLDFDNHKAFVRRVEPDYYTEAMTYTDVTVLDEETSAAQAWSGSDYALDAGAGEVSVVEKVVGYKKIKYHTHENVGYGDVHLPEMQMHTTACWFTVPNTLVEAQPVTRAVVIDALRGLTKALHTVAVVGLMIDPRDLGRTLGEEGGDGAPRKGQSGGAEFDPTLFLYDTIPGGVGLSGRVFAERARLWEQARALIERCGCTEGCPSCIGPAVGGGEISVDTTDAAAASAQVDAQRQPMPRKAIALRLLDALGVHGETL